MVQGVHSSLCPNRLPRRGVEGGGERPPASPCRGNAKRGPKGYAGYRTSGPRRQALIDHMTTTVSGAACPPLLPVEARDGPTGGELAPCVMGWHP